MSVGVAVTRETASPAGGKPLRAVSARPADGLGSEGNKASVALAL